MPAPHGSGFVGRHYGEVEHGDCRQSTLLDSNNNTFVLCYVSNSEELETGKLL